MLVTTKGREVAGGVAFAGGDRWAALRRRVSLVALALAALLRPGAAAAEPSAVDRATAQSLFDDARKLMDGANYAAACPKFAESLRFDPGLGTTLRLADCYEKGGQTASAWALFLDATDVAKKASDPREKIAQARADALAPRVPKLEVRVAAPGTPGLIVKRDGIALRAALLGTAAPVDPGTHVIEASAPGRATWTRSVEVPASGAVVLLVVPPLAEERAPAAVADATRAPNAAPPEPVGAPAASGPARFAGYAVAGVGAVGVAAGVLLYASAKSKHDGAAALCTQSAAFTHCPDAARADNDSAKSRGTVAVIALGVGVAALGIGVVMLLTGGTRTETGLRITPLVDARSGGLAISGSL